MKILGSFHAQQTPLSNSQNHRFMLHWRKQRFQDVQLPDVQLPDVQLPDAQLPDAELLRTLSYQDVQLPRTFSYELRLIYATLPATLAE